MRFSIRTINSMVLAMTLVVGAPVVLMACGAPSTTQSATTTGAKSTTVTTRTVKDSKGNDIEIPANVTKVAPIIGAFAQVTEMLDPGAGKIVASVQGVDEQFATLFPDYKAANPNNYNARSVEDLIAAGCQVAYGPSSLFSDEQVAQLKKGGVAFVGLDKIQTVDGMCECIQTIGQILGDEQTKTAEQFVKYYKDGISDATQRTSKLADVDKLKLLQLRYSGDAYGTTNGDDISNEYFEAAGAINTAVSYAGDSNGKQLTVDAEQILAWNPDVIITDNAAGTEHVLADPALQKVKAVQNKRVYTCPTGLYLWSVRSGEGALCTPWVGTKLYPELFSDVNIPNKIKEFYKTYYHHDLSDADAQAINDGTNAAASGTSTKGK